MNRHQYRLHVFKETYEDGSFEYVAEYPEIAGVMGVGDSPEEAVKEAESAKNAYLAYLKEMKKPYPKVLNLDKLSGRITFRMSKSLHKKVVERAEIENVSINQLINEAVNAYVCSNDTIEKAIDRISSTKNVQNVFVYTKHDSQDSSINNIRYKGGPEFLSDFDGDSHYGYGGLQ